MVKIRFYLFYFQVKDLYIFWELEQPGSYFDYGICYPVSMLLIAKNAKYATYKGPEKIN